jgi:hypothetical protein
MQGSTFSVDIPNISAIQSALADYPAISTPIIQRAIVAAQAVLAKFTTAETVPIKTGNLVQNWGFEVGNLQARYWPRASYAPFVEFGTKPHEIRPVTKRGLANIETGQYFGQLVHHPGTKPNPFLERILAAAQSEIATLFVTALEQVMQAVAEQDA